MAGTRSVSATRLGVLELAAWTGFLRAHDTLTRRLDRELHSESGISLAQYDVLVTVAHAPDRRMRMTDLADSVLLSRSGLTRLVDRLEMAGYLARRACPSDARVTYAMLAPAGLTKLREASEVHLRGVREHMTSRLNRVQLQSLHDITSSLLDA